MRILALDTSGTQLLACGLTEAKTKSLSLKAAARQDMLLDKALAKVMPEGTLDAIAVGVGPGRFTGIRIGLSYAVILGKALKIPVGGFRGLESLAFQASYAGKTGVFCVALHSIRDEWFFGLFRVSGPGQVKALSEETWAARAELERTAKASGAAIYEGPLDAATLARRAESLMKAGTPLPPAAPYYLKPGNYEKK